LSFRTGPPMTYATATVRRTAATQASAAKGEAALAHGAQAFVELLGEMERFDLARLREGPLSDSAYDLSLGINR